MATITIRNILQLALPAQPQPMGMGSRIHQRYVDVFGDEAGNDNEPLALPARSDLARGVDLES